MFDRIAIYKLCGHSIDYFFNQYSNKLVQEWGKERDASETIVNSCLQVILFAYYQRKVDLTGAK